ncbi:MAG: hypothetical protein H0U66_01320 [Gemmatimonadaceae bacterium]|nr:hypothetical protein [Gemmatimonadaceae bacterium]
MTVSSGPRAVREAIARAPFLPSVHLDSPRTHARHAILGFALALLPIASASAQTVLGYGEDATAAPIGAIRIRLSNDWHRSRSFGNFNDTTYDSDRQYRASTIGLELGVLKRLSLGVTVPWVTTKALTFQSSPHVHDTLNVIALDTLYDTSHNGWGNIEALAKVVWLGEPGQQARLEPRDGVHVRSAVAGGAYFGTGSRIDPRDPFAIGTSDRSRSLVLESLTDVTVGPHFFGSIVGRYQKPMSDNVLVAIKLSDNPLGEYTEPFTAARRLGTKYEVEITPRYQFGRNFTVGAQYHYRHSGEDRYSGQTTYIDGDGNEQTVDASMLNSFAPRTEKRIGFGAVYSSVDGYTRNRSRIPAEVSFQYSKVVSLSGGYPKESQVTFAVRLFHRLWGSEFAPPAAAATQPTLEPDATPPAPAPAPQDSTPPAPAPPKSS